MRRDLQSLVLCRPLSASTNQPRVMCRTVNDSVQYSAATTADATAQALRAPSPFLQNMSLAIIPAPQGQPLMMRSTPTQCCPS